MPAFYAHLTFARQVRKSLPGSFSEAFLPEKDTDIYEIGAQGPDILFFYNPATRNEAGNMAHAIHDASGKGFFMRAAEKIRAEKEENRRSQMRTYALGCICHLALDAVCHPAIEDCIRRTSVSHHEIEKEMDKYLMRKDGLEPFSFRFQTGFRPTPAAERMIARFYGLSSHIVHASMRNYLWISRMFFTRHQWVRKPVFAVLRAMGIYDEVHGFFANKSDNPRCRDFCRRMAATLDDNIAVCARMQQDFIRYLEGEVPGLTEDFDRPFSVQQAG